MEKSTEKGEIVAYQADGELHIDVRLENETVWLTQAQMAELFQKNQSVIARHIRKAFSEKEIDSKSNMQILHNTLSKFKPTTIYSLDVIISVGYRVKSIQGTQFRRWANKVLKEHLLKGYSINQRLLQSEERIDRYLASHENSIANLKFEQESHSARITALENQVEFFVKGPRPPKGGILPANSQWDGFALVAELVKSAEKSVVFIDPFADEAVLNFASLRKANVKAIVYTARVTANLKKQVEIHNRQYPELELRNMREVHDRFLLIDETVYHVGSSFKDIGNKLFGYSILDFITAQQVMEMVK